MAATQKLTVYGHFRMSSFCFCSLCCLFLVPSSVVCFFLFWGRAELLTDKPGHSHMHAVQLCQMHNSMLACKNAKAAFVVPYHADK